MGNPQSQSGVPHRMTEPGFVVIDPKYRSCIRNRGISFSGRNCGQGCSPSYAHGETIHRATRFVIAKEVSGNRYRWCLHRCNHGCRGPAASAPAWWSFSSSGVTFHLNARPDGRAFNRLWSTELKITLVPNGRRWFDGVRSISTSRYR
jgi:hypothetical protein